MVASFSCKGSSSEISFDYTGFDCSKSEIMTDHKDSDCLMQAIDSIRKDFSCSMQAIDSIRMNFSCSMAINTDYMATMTEVVGFSMAIAAADTTTVRSKVTVSTETDYLGSTKVTDTVSMVTVTRSTTIKSWKSMGSNSETEGNCCKDSTSFDSAYTDIMGTTSIETVSTDCCSVHIKTKTAASTVSL